MLHRSKLNDVTSPSNANASWSIPASTETSIPGELSAFINPKACSSGLHLMLQQKHHTETSVTPEQATTLHKTGKRKLKQSTSLIDDEKLDRLLSMLRSNEFVGQIDPEYHERYLLPPSGIEISNSKSDGQGWTGKHQRRSLASFPQKERDSSFSQALKKIKSTPHVRSSHSLLNNCVQTAPYEPTGPS